MIVLPECLIIIDQCLPFKRAPLIGLGIISTCSGIHTNTSDHQMLPELIILAQYDWACYLWILQSLSGGQGQPTG